MPEISRFFGIIISMYFNDHDPPHFHVRYGEHRATMQIDPLQILRGELPSRVQALVTGWAHMHASELRENWTRLRAEGTFLPIAPLT